MSDDSLPQVPFLGNHQTPSIIHFLNKDVEMARVFWGKVSHKIKISFADEAGQLDSSI
jgi:hypothetical protein